MSRSMFDLSHYCYLTGYVGLGRVMDVYDVVPGDSLQLQYTGAIRLSPMRRSLALDLNFTMVTFFVPWRHVYGRKVWETWIGGDNPSRTLPDPFSNVADYAIISENDAHWMAGYRAHRYWLALLWIWDNYLRDPHGDVDLRDKLTAYGSSPVLSAPTSTGSKNYSLTDPSIMLAAAAKSNGNNSAAYQRVRGGSGIDSGYRIPICHLQQTRTVFARHPETADIQNVGITSNKLNLPDLEEAKALLELDRRRQWFGRRYTELMANLFGSRLSNEEEYKPELLGRTVAWSSGYDIDATDSGGLGSNSGKGYVAIRHSISRKFFLEHGCVITMALPRFPLVPIDEVPYVLGAPNPSWLDYGGQASLIATQPPVTVNEGKLNYSTATPSIQLGLWPYGQEWRHHHDIVDPKFGDLQGYPFPEFGSGEGRRVWCTPSQYNDIFQTLQLRHWHSQLMVSAKRFSALPGEDSSIFAGVD